MTKLKLSGVVLGCALITGCASIHLVKTASDGSKVEFNTTSLFSNSAIKGLTVDGSTKTTTNALRITSGGTEPNPESITASGDAIGTIIGNAVKAAATK